MSDNCNNMGTVLNEGTVDFVVAVCDDEIGIVEELSTLVEKVLEQNNKNCKIVGFLSGEKLLKNIEKIDLVFLDIDMPGINGIEVGNRIKSLKNECKIIMATGREDCYKDAFKIQAFRYVTKPFEINEISEALVAYINSRHGEDFIDAYYNRSPYRIKQKDIRYIRAMDSYSEIIVSNRVLRTEKSMAKLEEELDPVMFFRIHKQYIVNMAAVEQYKKDAVIIQNERLCVSRRKKNEFEKKVLEYELIYG